MLIHSSERAHKCEQCNACFKHAGSLKSHMLLHGPKAFKCSFCEHTFARNDTKKIHEKTHTGEKSFGCSQCDKWFCKKKICEKHERKVHNITWLHCLFHNSGNQNQNSSHPLSWLKSYLRRYYSTYAQKKSVESWNVKCKRKRFIRHAVCLDVIIIFWPINVQDWFWI